jgi:hypothetical protein
MATGTQLQSNFSSGGPICEIRGLIRKTISSRSRVKVLNLVKFIENSRKMIKRKANFSGFLVTVSTTFTKHDHTFASYILHEKLKSV